ncbi:hypothetical protein BC828DRAFT_412757 [Blastocladiella britannica]|nr:hypothetical protein BC828DRAFT_412757 [Blastocladiella britannica]
MGNLFSQQREGDTRPLTRSGAGTSFNIRCGQCSIYDVTGSGGQSTNEADDFRQQAFALVEERQELAKQSQAAYQSGNHGNASKFSQQAKAAGQRADAEHLRARNAHLTSNNPGIANEHRPGDTRSTRAYQMRDWDVLLSLDLHGLLAQEAMTVLQDRISAVQDLMRDARVREAKVLEVITGRGNHSQQRGGPVLYGRVQEYLRQQRIEYRLDPRNDGVVNVHLPGSAPGYVPPTSATDGSAESHGVLGKLWSVLRRVASALS